MLGFLISYGVLVNNLSRLLEMRFTPGETGNDSPVGKSLRKVLDYHNRGEYSRRDHELAKMQLLTKHLGAIGHHDHHMLGQFAKQLRDSHGWDQYFGARLEINVAASLIRKGVTFRKREHPDFAILNTNDVCIECASTHMNIPKTYDGKYNISRVIRAKSAKPYCNARAALFIDVTNLLYNDATNQIFFAKAELAAYVTKLLQQHRSQFGSVVLFTYMINKVLNRFESNYMRVDNTSLAPSLLFFLDQCYPHGNHVVDDFAYPNYG